MRIFFIFLCLFSAHLKVVAQSRPALRFEPVYGIEHTELKYPKPARAVSQATLGGRVLYGTRLLSAEMEITRSQGRRSYEGSDTTTRDEVTRLQLGFRSQAQLFSLLGWYLRGGLSAKKQRSEITQSGVTTTEEPPMDFGPYAGSGLSLSIASLLSLNAGANLIYYSQAEERSYDVQYTLGFSFHLGNN